MKRNQFVCAVICILSAAHSLFAQKESLTLSKQFIKSGHWCSVSNSGLQSLHDGDTLVFHKKDGRSCTYTMNFRTGNRFLLKEFTSRTYDGKPVLEFKTKGKWNLEKGSTQLLFLDFETVSVVLQLIHFKDDSLEFIVQRHEEKQKK